MASIASNTNTAPMMAPTMLPTKVTINSNTSREAHCSRRSASAAT